MAIKNMLLNSDFEHPTNPTYNWQLEAPYVTLQNTGGNTGPKCVKFDMHPTGAAHVLAQSMDLVPGVSYQFKCQANFVGSHMSLYFTMRCDKPNGQTSVQNSNVFSGGSGWREISHNFAVPSDVSSENVWLNVYATNTSGATGTSYALVDNVQLVGEDGVGSGAVNTYRRTVDWTMMRPIPTGMHSYSLWPNALVKIAEKLTINAETCGSLTG